MRARLTRLRQQSEVLIMRTMPHLAAIVILLSLSLSAQSPDKEHAANGAPAPAEVLKRSADAAALDRLLLEAINLESVSFQVRWNWAATSLMGQRVAGGAQNVRVRRVGPKKEEDQHLRGAAYPNVLRIDSQGDKARETLLFGRIAIVREADEVWRLADRRALGMDEPLPDPLLLLLALRAAGFEVLDRSIADRDQRAVESFAITLSAKQVEALVASGAINDPDPRGSSFREIAARSNVAIADLGGAVVDVAIDFDVATRQIRRVHVRALTKPTDTKAALQRMRGGAAETDAGDEGEGVAKAGAMSPTEFRLGLPVRETEGQELRELEILLADHGKLPPLELDAVQRRLLGR